MIEIENWTEMRVSVIVVESDERTKKQEYTVG